MRQLGELGRERRAQARGQLDALIGQRRVGALTQVRPAAEAAVIE